jgi:hypothetical protein
MLVVHALMNAVCMKFQIFRTCLWTFSSFLPLMNFPYLNNTASCLRLKVWLKSFFFDSPFYPEMVDKMALLIYWELEYSESTQKLWQLTYEHTRSPLVFRCGCLEMTYISYRHLKVHTTCFLSGVDMCITFKKMLTVVWVARLLFKL